MKIMIASDLHGSAKYCRALLDARAYEQPDNLLLLGDLLSRVVVSPIVLPIDAITSFLGGPLFLYLLFKGNKKSCCA